VTELVHETHAITTHNEQGIQPGWEYVLDERAATIL
jgi:hypothetical protein